MFQVTIRNNYLLLGQVRHRIYTIKAKTGLEAERKALKEAKKEFYSRFDETKVKETVWIN